MFKYWSSGCPGSSGVKAVGGLATAVLGDRLCCKEGKILEEGEAKACGGRLEVLFRRN